MRRRRKVAKKHVKRSTKVVSWTMGSATKPVVAPVYPTYRVEQDPSERVVRHLSIGSLFVTTCASSPYVDTVAPREHPILDPVWGWTPVNRPVFNRGTVFLYAGMVRCREQKINGMVIDVKRHCFIGPTGRVIVIGIEAALEPVATLREVGPIMVRIE